MPKSPEKLIKECAEKLKEIFDGVEVEGTTVYYKGRELIYRGWISAVEGDPCDPAIFIETFRGTDIMILDWWGEGFENTGNRLLTYAIASIVAYETVGEASGASVGVDERHVRIEVGDTNCSWLSLEFPYISPSMDIRLYKVEVRFYREGGLEVETIGEFAPNDFETLRKIVALYLF
jgi:hypothetical protein